MIAIVGATDEADADALDISMTGNLGGIFSAKFYLNMTEARNGINGKVKTCTLAHEWQLCTFSFRPLVVIQNLQGSR